MYTAGFMSFNRMDSVYFSDGLLRTRTRAEREKEREEAGNDTPSSVDKGGSRYVRFRKRELKRFDREKEKETRDGEKKKK